MTAAAIVLHSGQKETRFRLSNSFESTHLNFVDKIHIPFMDHKTCDMTWGLTAYSAYPSCSVYVVRHVIRKIKIDYMTDLEANQIR